MPAAAPGAPGSLVATGGPGQVGLTWTAAAANGAAVTNYRIERGTSSGGEALLTTVGNVTSYIDTAVTPGTTYFYTVRAVNAVGDGSQSTEASATPTVPPLLLSADFETGNLSGWTVTGPIAASTVSPHAGTWAARDQCVGSACWAYRPFSSGQSAADVWVRVWVYVAATDNNATNLFKLRTNSSGSGAAVFGILLNNKGRLSSRNDVVAKTTSGTHTLSLNQWHRVTVHLTIGTAGHVDVYLDGTLIPELSKNDNLGTAAIAKLQLGENGSGARFDARFDDISVSSTAIAP